MGVYSIELPNKKILDIEADDEAAALRGAQEWFAENPLSRHIDFKQPEEHVREQIGMLPEGERETALRMWADDYVKDERADGGVGQRIGDTINRVSRSVPGVGTWIDELNAGTAAIQHNLGVGGAPYEEAKAYQEAKDRAIDATETQTVGTLPLIGDVTTGGLEKAAGTVAGALAMPMARLMPGATALPTAVNVGGNAAAVGAVQGAGEGDGVAERAENALRSGILSGLVAAPLGAAVGGIAGRALPKATDDIARAAAQVGVDLPKAAAVEGTKGTVTRAVAGRLKDIPVVGQPIVDAQKTALDQLKAAGSRIADDYASGVTAQGAGSSAREGITGWIKGDSVRVMDRLYGDVGTRMPGYASKPLTNTRTAAQRLAQEDRQAASSVNVPAIRMVEDALNAPGGLTYQGLMRLRTNVGAMIDDGLLPAAGTTKPALKRLYGALTQDLDDTVRTFGGPDAVRAWEKANRITREIENRREMLTKIIGSDGAQSGEAVADRLVRMAGSKSTGDIQRLMQARKAVGADVWDEVSSNAIHALGRGRDGSFNLSNFLNGYSSLSENGRNVLFASTSKSGLKKDLDALAKLSEKHKELQALGNHSGTGGLVATLSGLSGLWLAPMHTIGTAVSGYVLAKALASPVHVRNISRFARAVYEGSKTPKGQASLKLATMTLAKSLADLGGGDEDEIASRLTGAQ